MIMYKMPEGIELSIVIPVYNSGDIFPELYNRLVSILSGIVDTYEILTVVDGCVDESSKVIETFAKKDSNLKMIEFSRNFGHQAAITAGLEFASGQRVVVMDDDLEDPPEMLPKLIEKAREGYDVVYGIRKKRKVSLFRRFSYRLFYRLINRLANIDMPQNAGDFCIMSRSVVETLRSMPESNRYIRGMRTWLGFSQIGVEYDRGQRSAGESGYSLIKYLKLAFDGIVSFSYKPLIYVSLLGFIIALISFILGFRLIVLKLLGKIPDVPGWASIMVVVLFIGGIQLISVGIVGQYIARIYDEVKKRPHFVVKRQVGFDKRDYND